MANGIACALCLWSPHLSSPQDSGARDSKSHGPRSPAGVGWAGVFGPRTGSPTFISRETLPQWGRPSCVTRPPLVQYQVSVGSLVVPLERSASSLGCLRPRGVVSDAQRLPRVTAAVIVGGAGKGGAPVPPRRVWAPLGFTACLSPPQGN